MFTRRLVQLLWGLALYGISMALMLRANLGLDPWDVLHQGLAPRIGLSFGMTVNLLGLIVLLLWIPLRQRPGIGTVLNIIVIGTVVDLSLLMLPVPEGYPVRCAFLIAGVVLNGIAGGAYIGAGLGPGPRDGLMTGIAGRTGWPIKIVRTAIELSVLAAGWLMGGTVGVGTVLYALTIGWVVHYALPFFTLGRKDAGREGSKCDEAKGSGCLIQGEFREPRLGPEALCAQRRSIRVETTDPEAAIRSSHSGAP